MVDDAVNPSAAPALSQGAEPSHESCDARVAIADDAVNLCDAPIEPQGAEQASDSCDGRAPISGRSEGVDIPAAAKRVTYQRRKLSKRTIGLALAFLGMSAIIAVDVVIMVRSRSHPNEAVGTSVEPTHRVGPALAVSETSASAEVPPSAEVLPSVALAPGADGTAPGFDDESVEGEPSPTRPEVPRHYPTVQEAASRSCSTASVEGLSRQIIAEARCINPNTYVPLPPRPNLLVGPHVFAYLEIAARDHLVRVLDAHRDGTMTINSALRTVAQQYLVWRWSANKRCGVQLATPPGDSNHESGLALDIAEQAKWRPALEAQEFHWLGASDRVHFDYKGSGASPHRSSDVLAFQRLWNRNHPDDAISSDGHYSATTEQRLKKAPPDGFRLGPSCTKHKVAEAGN